MDITNQRQNILLIYVKISNLTLHYEMRYNKNHDAKLVSHKLYLFHNSKVYYFGKSFN